MKIRATIVRFFVVLPMIAALVAGGVGGAAPAAASAPTAVPTAAPAANQQALSFETRSADGMVEFHFNYLLFLPRGYGADPQEKWPLILFLHGMGERGDTPADLARVKAHGPPEWVEKRPDLPFIVLSPQCPTTAFWVDELAALNALLDYVVATYAVDPTRLYLTGLSMGGEGTWALATKYPDRFAALAPVAAYGQTTAGLCGIKGIPVWAFHGAKDRRVPLPWGERMVKTLQDCGGNVRFTVYLEAEHDESTWNATYENPELYAWLLEQER
jgi:predicted peptidase